MAHAYSGGATSRRTPPGGDQVNATGLRAEIERLIKTASAMPVASELASGYRERIAELRAELHKLDGGTGQPASKTPEQKIAALKSYAAECCRTGDNAASASALAEAYKIAKAAEL